MSEQNGSSGPIAFLCTSSLHLADMLGTMGVKHLKLQRGPDLTPDGRPKVRWVFEDTPTGEEVMKLWNASRTPSKFAWDALSEREKHLVIDVVSAFADNLKHYHRHTHG